MKQSKHEVYTNHEADEIASCEATEIMLQMQ